MRERVDDDPLFVRCRQGVCTSHQYLVRWSEEPCTRYDGTWYRSTYDIPGTSYLVAGTVQRTCTRLVHPREYNRQGITNGRHG